MKVLVSGITGFIGRHLGHKLLDQGHEVLGISRQENPDLSLRGKNRFEMFQLDLRTNNLIGKLPADVDMVFNYAALLQRDSKFSDLLINNVLTTYNLFEYAENISSKFVQASTGSVYSWDDLSQTIDEEVTPNPRTQYGLSKYLADVLILSQCQHVKNRAYILRYPIVYGSEGSDNIVSEIYHSAQEGENIKLLADTAERKINIVHVRDVVNANISLMLKSDQIKSGEIFLVGNKKSLKVSRLAEKIIEDLDSKSEIKIQQANHEAPPDVVWDISKAEEVLGLNPKIGTFT